MKWPSWIRRGCQSHWASEPGEIAVRGHNVMLRYWRDEEATKKAFDFGYLRTGDEGLSGRPWRP